MASAAKPSRADRGFAPVLVAALLAGLAGGLVTAASPSGAQTLENTPQPEIVNGAYVPIDRCLIPVIGSIRGGNAPGIVNYCGETLVVHWCRTLDCTRPHTSQRHPPGFRRTSSTPFGIWGCREDAVLDRDLLLCVLQPGVGG